MALNLTDRLDRDRTPSILGTSRPGGHCPRLRHDGAVGGTAGVRPHRLVSRRYPGGVCDHAHATAPLRVTSTSRWARACRSRPDCVAGTVRARPPSGGAERPRARCGRRSWVDGDPTRNERPAPTSSAPDAPIVRRCSTSTRGFVDPTTTPWKRRRIDLVFDVIGGHQAVRRPDLAGERWCPSSGRETRPADGLLVDFVVESDRAELVRSSSGCGRRLRRTSATSHPRQAVAALNPTERRKERRSSAFVPERRAPIDKRSGRRCQSAGWRAPEYSLVLRQARQPPSLQHQIEDPRCITRWVAPPDSIEAVAAELLNRRACRRQIPSTPRHMRAVDMPR